MWTLLIEYIIYEARLLMLQCFSATICLLPWNRFKNTQKNRIIVSRLLIMELKEPKYLFGLAWWSYTKNSHTHLTFPFAVASAWIFMWKPPIDAKSLRHLQWTRIRDASTVMVDVDVLPSSTAKTIVHSVTEQYCEDNST